MNDSHQDPAEPYRTDTSVETDKQPNAVDELAKEQASENEAPTETTVTESPPSEDSSESDSSE